MRETSDERFEKETLRLSRIEYFLFSVDHSDRLLFESERRTVLAPSRIRGFVSAVRTLQKGTYSTLLTLYLDKLL